MNIRTTVAAGVAGALAFAGMAAHASSFNASYFEVPDPTAGDFGICCSSPPATLPVIALGSSLVGGLPVTTLAASSGGVTAQSASGQIEWWSPSLDASVTSTGSGAFTLGTLHNMYAPDSTGSDDAAEFETAIISGEVAGDGSDATITVSSDDDALVYVDGTYRGGNPGVHPTETTTIDLGDLTGEHSVEVFYADRAQVDATLGLSLTNLSVVPEPASWALMLVGFGAAGLTLRSRRRVTFA